MGLLLILDRHEGCQRDLIMNFAPKTTASLICWCSIPQNSRPAFGWCRVMQQHYLEEHRR